jgi:hypothetical protein
MTIEENKGQESINLQSLALPMMLPIFSAS